SAAEAARQPLVRARQIERKGTDASRDEMKLAISLSQRVVERDPADAEAWALLARLHCNLYDNYERTSERLIAAEGAARNALSLAPNSIPARLAQARVYGRQKASHRQSLDLLRRLEREAPGNPDVLVTLADTLFIGGADSSTEMLGLCDRALSLEPDNPMALHYKAWALSYAGRTAEADTLWNDNFRRTGSPSALVGRFYDLANHRGNDAEARALLAQFPSDLVFNDTAVRVVTQFWLAQSEPAKALAFIQPFPRELIEDYFHEIPKGYLAGKAHAQAGHVAAAQLEWRKGLDAVNRQLATHPEKPRLINYKARLHYLLGETDEATRQAELYQQLTSVQQ